MLLRDAGVCMWMIPADCIIPGICKFGRVSSSFLTATLWFLLIHAVHRQGPSNARPSPTGHQVRLKGTLFFANSCKCIFPRCSIPFHIRTRTLTRVTSLGGYVRKMSAPNTRATKIAVSISATSGGSSAELMIRECE